MSEIKNLSEKADHYNSLFNDQSSVEILKKILPEEKAVLSTSFSFEDQVVTDMIAENRLSARIFTIDTGRLFTETYKVHQLTLEKYLSSGIQIETYFPDHSDVENYVNTNGPDAFYLSQENRLECCRIRKVLPLKRALAGATLWITGIRSEHSPGRGDSGLFEFDQGNNIIKFHPLLRWTTDEVKDYIKEHNVPYNTLHDRGFPSIGCAPCTRAVQDGEEFRSGRWWWENESHKECGLHIQDGKIIRRNK